MTKYLKQMTHASMLQIDLHAILAMHHTLHHNISMRRLSHVRLKSNELLLKDMSISY